MDDFLARGGDTLSLDMREALPRTTLMRFLPEPPPTPPEVPIQPEPRCHSVISEGLVGMGFFTAGRVGLTEESRARSGGSEEEAPTRCE